MNQIRLRFAPSPTGELHIGNARTALFNWLFARKHPGAKLVLRIEDTDTARSTRESEVSLISDLRWLGLDWDEGPEVGGPHGPYRQSERLEIYRQYAEQLRQAGHVYPCYCTLEELETERLGQLSRKQPPRYSNKCHKLTDQQRADLEAQGRKPSLRFHIGDRHLKLTDVVKGNLDFNLALMGDFIIIRADGSPTYNFSVVIDDMLMQITHVLRGEDHLSNTPRQWVIYQALNATPPQFGHLPLIVGPDNAPLSKRHGATSVAWFREQGYLPEALINYLALLGWSPGDNQELLSLQEMAARFSLAGLSSNPSRFDLDKLNWFNRTYLLKLPENELQAACRPYISPAAAGTSDGHLSQVLGLLKDEAKTLVELGGIVSAYLADAPVLPPDLRAILDKPEAREMLNHLLKIMDSLQGEQRNFAELTRRVQQETGARGKQLYQPLRVALTGQMHGPELVKLFEVMGWDWCRKRIQQSLN